MWCSACMILAPFSLLAGTASSNSCACTRMNRVAVGPLLAELDKCWPGPSDSLAYQAIKEKIAKESEHDENSLGNLYSPFKIYRTF